jgi:hypothetical protein
MFDLIQRKAVRLRDFVALPACAPYAFRRNLGGWMKKSVRILGCIWVVTLVLVSLVGAQAASSLVSEKVSTGSAGDASGSQIIADSASGTWHEAGPSDRMFLPHDMFWGWAQFDLAPPHNEVDPNLCAGNAGQYGGVNAPCSLFARYMLSGVLEVRPFGRTQLRRFMVFGAPTFLFGKTVPKTLYTWSADAIGIEHSWGAGIYITKGYEFRVTQHFLFDRLGARNKNLGLADLGNNGPWGRYMTLGVRKTWGTRRW